MIKNVTEIKPAVIGLGYVGLPLALEISKYWETLGFDINETRIVELNNFYDRTNEVTFSEIEDSKSLNFTLTNQK